MAADCDINMWSTIVLLISYDFVLITKKIHEKYFADFSKLVE